MGQCHSFLAVAAALVALVVVLVVVVVVAAVVVVVVVVVAAAVEPQLERHFAAEPHWQLPLRCGHQDDGRKDPSCVEALERE